MALNPDKKIAFVAMANQVWSPWGGSEELWSEAALILQKDGFGVEAYVQAWSPPHPRLLRLIEGGIQVWSHPKQYSPWRRVWQKISRPNEDILATDVERSLRRSSPSLVVLNDGFALPPIDLIEVCARNCWPFVCVSHADHELWWPGDEIAARYQLVLSRALRCYFVSNANWRLVEKQIGCRLSNGEVVRNPFGVPLDFPVTWPPLGPGEEIRFACVGRLDPAGKGQDLLLEVLASPVWKDRNWRLTFYGEGRCRQVIGRLVDRYDLSSRIQFAGHVAVGEIWASNHVLVLPSRYEGLPITIVEAMLCGRPVVTTNVAGNSEIVDDGVTGILADAATYRSFECAMERLWHRRAELKQMGIAGAASIRQKVPRNPAYVFSEKLKSLTI